MTYVITEACIKCKFTDCVQVCPVDCFHEGENMLVIDPEKCIDCGICVPECPAGAIVKGSAPEASNWRELNKKYSSLWPNITYAKIPSPDAETWKEVEGKYKKFFSPNPASDK